MQKRLMSIILAVMLLAAMATTAGAATYEEINQQWYDTHYWTDMHAQADELDKLIDEFNDATGVLANM